MFANSKNQNLETNEGVIPTLILSISYCCIYSVPEASYTSVEHNLNCDITRNIGWFIYNRLKGAYSLLEYEQFVFLFRLII